MDFITSLPKSKNQNDSIFVVIDKLSKAAHFIPMNSTYKAMNIVDIFLKEIFRLHGYPRQTSWIKVLSLQEILDIFILRIGDAVEL